MNTHQQKKNFWMCHFLCGSAFYLLHAHFLFGFFFDSEYGGDIFLQNFSWLSTDYTGYIPKGRNLHNYCCENLKSYNIHLIFSVFTFSPTSLLASIRVLCFSSWYLLWGKSKVVSVLNQLGTMPWGRMGKWMYKFTYSWPQPRWRWVVSFTPHPLYSCRKGPW
jgi:hypothetical protein